MLGTAGCSVELLKQPTERQVTSDDTHSAAAARRERIVRLVIVECGFMPTTYPEWELFVPSILPVQLLTDPPT